MFTDSDGLQIWFNRTGDGKPLVMVHGWGAYSRTNWIETGWMDVLADRRALILMDVRGHGQSSKPHVPELYGYGAMSRDVLAVLDALDVDTCDLMGYSMGAFMGAWLLGHHPERFTGMVLGGIGSETEASAAQGAVIAEMLRHPERAESDPAAAGVLAFVRSTPDHDLEALACSAEQMWPEGHALAVAGPGISKAHFPVLIVNGANDHPYVDSADAFADALPKGRHLVIPDTDHLSTVASGGFKRAVREFLT